MFGSAWLVLKEAQATYGQGRFAEAYRLASRSKVRTYRRAGRLRDRVRRQLVGRWIGLARDGYPEAALSEMGYCPDIIGSDAELGRIRHGLETWTRACRLDDRGDAKAARAVLGEVRGLLPELGSRHPGLRGKLGVRMPIPMQPSHDRDPTGSPGRRLEPPVAATAERLLLWIDGVGGYLICLGDRVRVGQAAPDSPAEVPLYANVSRVHATLVRVEGEYRVVAHKPVYRNGSRVDETVVVEGDRLRLGASTELVFTRPSPGSRSAVLELVGPGRLGWSADAVVLWADTLELGPGRDAHVWCPDAEAPVVLFRQVDRLLCRTEGTLELDGRPAEQPATLVPTVRVRTGAVSFALERIEAAGRER